MTGETMVLIVDNLLFLQLDKVYHGHGGLLLEIVVICRLFLCQSYSLHNVDRSKIARDSAVDSDLDLPMKGIDHGSSLKRSCRSNSVAVHTLLRRLEQDHTGREHTL